MSVEEYMGKLQPIWEELHNLTPLSLCDCGNCTCNLLEQQMKIRKTAQLHDFLFGLYIEFYGTVRSNLWILLTAGFVMKKL